MHWLDRRGEVLEVTIEVVVVPMQWTRRSVAISAPDAAVTAVVYTSVHGQSRVWFDDFVLARSE